MKMLGRVLVLRIVTAADMSARQAQSKMHPCGTRLEALLAALSRWSHVVDLLKMSAGRRSHVSSSKAGSSSILTALTTARLSIFPRFSRSFSPDSRLPRSCSGRCPSASCANPPRAVDLRFVLAGQQSLAGADQAADEFIATHTSTSARSLGRPLRRALDQTRSR